MWQWILNYGSKFYKKLITKQAIWGLVIQSKCGTAMDGRGIF